MRIPARFWLTCLVACCAAWAGVVQAEVKAATPDAFQIVFSERIAAPPATVYASIGQVER